MFVYVNPNPSDNLTGDCVIRAISISLRKDWRDVYLDLMRYGFELNDMPSANWVWSTYLYDQGYRCYVISDYTRRKYTVKDFCAECKDCVGILATGTHVIAIRYGDYYDTWDSGNEVPLYYWRKEK